MCPTGCRSVCGVVPITEPTGCRSGVAGEHRLVVWRAADPRDRAATGPEWQEITGCGSAGLPICRGQVPTGQWSAPWLTVRTGLWSARCLALVSDPIPTGWTARKPPRRRSARCNHRGPHLVDGQHLSDDQHPSRLTIRVAGQFRALAGAKLVVRTTDLGEKG